MHVKHFVIEGVDTEDGSRTVLDSFDNSSEAIGFLQRYVSKENAGGWDLIEIYDCRSDDAELIKCWSRQC